MPPSTSRILQLDILRFFAIALVIGAHLPNLDTVFPSFLRKTIIYYWTQAGWIGVDLFFVLSGFLISGLLFQEYKTHGDINLIRFLTRRAWRIYPSYWILLLFFIGRAISRHEMHHPEAFTTNAKLAASLLFFQNYVPGFYNMFYLWSLAVEEHFYILLPIALIYTIKNSTSKTDPFQWLPRISALLLIVALINRLITAHYSGSYNCFVNYSPSHLRFDSLLFGVILGYSYHFHYPRFIDFCGRYRLLLVIAGIVFILPEVFYPLETPFVYTWGMSFLYLGFGSIMSAFLAYPIRTVGVLSYIPRLIGFIGSHSYSIYLWHLPVKMWLTRYLHHWVGLAETKENTLFVYVFGSIIFGVFLSLLIESPTRWLRDKLYASRTLQTTTIPVSPIFNQVPASRIMELDILRCFAVFLVIGAHLPGFEGPLPSIIKTYVIPHWTRFGWIGVDLFFVLSGFLISGLLFKEYQTYGKIKLGQFLVRRGFRIYPPYWFLLAFTAYVNVINHTFNKSSCNYTLLMNNLLFLQNYLPGVPLPHLWSLAVEEYFYIVLPIVFIVTYNCVCSKTNPFRWLPHVSIGLMIFALGARLITAQYGVYSSLHNDFPTHLRFDSLLFGVLISYYYTFFQSHFIGFIREYWYIIAVAGMFLLIPEIYFPLGPYEFIYTFGFVFLYLGFGCLISLALVWPLPKTGLITYFLRPISYIGSHSYSIYLWHLPIKVWGPTFSQRWFGLTITPERNLFIYLVGSIVVGILLSIAIEAPSRIIRDALLPARGKIVPPTSPDAIPVESASILSVVGHPPNAAI